MAAQETTFLDQKVQQMNTNSSQPQQLNNYSNQPTQNLSQPPNNNIIINQNASLLPPPKLDLLLNNANSGSSLEPPKLSLLEPLQKNPTMTQPLQQPNNLLAQISNQRVDNIKNDPMYQQQPKTANLFEDDVEVGKEDLFKSSNKNKDKFSNLFTAPNNLANPFGNANPFDPFGLNAFSNPLNPVSQRPSVMKKEDNLLKAANDNSMFEDIKRPSIQPSKKDKLKDLFNESDSDDESRLNKQKLLTEKYKNEEISPIKQVTTNAANKTSKLFEDDDDAPLPTQKKAETIKAIPAARKSDMFKVEEIKREDEFKPQQTKPIVKKSIFDKSDDEDEDDKPIIAPRPKQSITNTVTAAPKKNVFGGDEGDEDDKPIIAPRPKQSITNNVNAAPKKNMFGGDDDEDDKPFTAKPKASITNNITLNPPKKNIFGGDDEDDDDKQIIAPKPKASITPIVNNPPKKNIFGGDDEDEEDKPIIPPRQKQSITPVVNNPPKKNIFGGDDNDDDDPLSKKPVSNRPSEKKSSPVKQEPQKVSFIEVKEEPKTEATVEKNETIFPPRPSLKKKMESSSSSDDSEKDRKPKPKAGGLNLKALEDQLKETEAKKEEASIQNRSSNLKVSSRISQLQEKLNLSQDIFKSQDENNLAPWRKTKGPEDALVDNPVPQQISNDNNQPEISTEQITELPSEKNEQIEIPPQEEKPSNDTGDKFQNIGPLTTSVAFFQPPQEQASPQPIVQNPEPVQNNYENVDDSQNPLNLLKGLKNMDNKKNNVKFSEPESNSMASDNPLALLSGLKEMDAEKNRKSTKKRDLFNDIDDKKSSSKLFGDDEEVIFKPKETGLNMKIFDDKPNTVAARQSEGKKLNKLFDESDEDDPLSKKKPQTSQQRVSALPKKTKSKLFDDDD